MQIKHALHGLRTTAQQLLMGAATPSAAPGSTPPRGGVRRRPSLKGSALVLAAASLLGAGSAAQAQASVETALPVCNPNKLYDILVSSFHQTGAQLADDRGWAGWGQQMGGGSTDIAPPRSILGSTSVGGTNIGSAFPDVKPLLVSNASSTTTHQTIALGNDGKFYAWGTQGTVLPSDLTSSTAVHQTTLGLPGGVSAGDVDMLFASWHFVAIVAKGNVYTIAASSTTSPLHGDGGSSATDNGWHKVKIDATTDLTGVTAVRGQVGGSSGMGAIMAVTEDGDVYTWGNNIYDGAGSGKISSSGAGSSRDASSFAKKMTLPTPVKDAASKVKQIGVTGGSSSPGSSPTDTTQSNSYYVLFENGELWSLGANTHRQLGDFSTVSTGTWTQVQKPISPDGLSGSYAPFQDVQMFSVQEHDRGYAGSGSVGAIDSIGDVYTWGSNNGNMIGAESDSTSDPKVQGALLANKGTGNIKARYIEVGGHTTAYSPQNSPKFCYVGHLTNGSMGNDTSSSGNPWQFDCDRTPAVNICGADSIGAVDDSMGNIPVPDVLTELTGNAYNNDQWRGTPADQHIGERPNPSQPATVPGIVGKVLEPAQPINWGPVPYLDAATGKVYAPAGTPPGDYTIKYEICDIDFPGEICTAADITVNILGIKAIPDTATTNVDVPVTTKVTDNDTSPSGVPINPNSVTVVTQPPNGNVVCKGDAGGASLGAGECTYTPNPGFKGTDTYTYEVCNTASPVECDTTTVTVAVGEPPVIVANDDSGATAKGVPLKTPVLANDVAVGGELNPSSVKLVGTPPANTTVVCAGGYCTLTSNVPGTYQYTYEVCMKAPEQAKCDTAEVTVVVVDDADPGTPGVPAATIVPSPDSDTTPVNTKVTTNVLQNDTALNGTVDPSSVKPVSTTSSKGGSVSCTAGKCDYTPPTGFVGTDTYQYEVCLKEDEGKCETTTVTIKVGDPSITAKNDTAKPNEALDVTTNDTPTGGELDKSSVKVLTDPDRGTVDCVAGVCTYTPTDPSDTQDDSYTYQVCLVNPAEACSTAVVTVTPPKPHVSVVVTPPTGLNVPGETVYGKVTCTSDGEAAANNAFCEIPVPPGAQEWEVQSCTYKGEELTVTNGKATKPGELPVGDEIICEYSYKVPGTPEQPGNPVTITGKSGCDAGTVCADEDDKTVEPNDPGDPHVSIVVTPPNGPLTPGEIVKGKVTCTSDGAVDAPNAVCEVDRPDEVPADKWKLTCTPAKTVNPLKVGDSIVCEYEYTVPNDPVEITGKSGCKDQGTGSATACGDEDGKIVVPNDPDAPKPPHITTEVTITTDKPVPGKPVNGTVICTSDGGVTAPGANCTVKPVPGVTDFEVLACRPDELPVALADGQTIECDFRFTMPEEPVKVEGNGRCEAANCDSDDAKIVVPAGDPHITITIPPVTPPTPEKPGKVTVICTSDGDVAADLASCELGELPPGVVLVPGGPVCTVQGAANASTGPWTLPPADEGATAPVKDSSVVCEYEFTIPNPPEPEEGTVPPLPPFTGKGECVNNSCQPEPEQGKPVVVAYDDTAKTTPGEKVQIVVTNNDLIVGGEKGTSFGKVTVLTQPANGKVACNGVTCDYTPDNDFFGTDSYTYKVCLNAPEDACSEAKVTITVDAQPHVSVVVTPPTGLNVPGEKVYGKVTCTSDGSVAAPDAFCTVPAPEKVKDWDDIICTYKGEEITPLTDGKTATVSSLPVGDEIICEYSYTVPEERVDLEGESGCTSANCGDTDEKPVEPNKPGDPHISVVVTPPNGPLLPNQPVKGKVTCTSDGAVDAPNAVCEVPTPGPETPPGWKVTCTPTDAKANPGTQNPLAVGDSIVCEYEYTVPPGVPVEVTGKSGCKGEATGSASACGDEDGKIIVPNKPAPKQPHITTLVTPPTEPLIPGNTVKGKVTCTSDGEVAAPNATCEVNPVPPGIEGWKVTCDKKQPVASLAVGAQIVCEYEYTVPNKPVKVEGNGRCEAANCDSDDGKIMVPPVGDGLLAVIKTVYQGHNAGGSCATGIDQKQLVVVNKVQAEVPVTWCFKVTNTGSASLTFDGANWDDPALLPGSTFVQRDGPAVLAPGESAVWYVQEQRKESVRNEVALTLNAVTPDGKHPLLDPETGKRITATGKDGMTEESKVLFGQIYDPPFGVKVGEAEGFDTIRWTMVWVNDNDVPVDNVTVSDVLKAPMTYAENLSCVPEGTTRVIECGYNPAKNEVYAKANFGADAGNTVANANNRLFIQFNVKVPANTSKVENQGVASFETPKRDPETGAIVVDGNNNPVMDTYEGVTDYRAGLAVDRIDPNNPAVPNITPPRGMEADDPALGRVPSTPGGPAATPVQPPKPANIPVDNPLALLLLAFGIMGFAARRHARQRG